jgi:flavodoxin
VPRGLGPGEMRCRLYQLLTGAHTTTGEREQCCRIAAVADGYFSRAGENYFYGGRTFLQIGNSQVVADMIAAAIAVDVYRIQAADPYPDSYDATVERNRQEQNNNARPAITGALPSVGNYDTVLLGSLIWNEQPPMIMRTFVESTGINGKALLPFVTYAVSGLGSIVDVYRQLCPQSRIGEARAVRGEEAASAQPHVHTWLRRAVHRHQRECAARVGRAGGARRIRRGQRGGLRAGLLRRTDRIGGRGVRRRRRHHRLSSGTERGGGCRGGFVPRGGPGGFGRPADGTQHLTPPLVVSISGIVPVLPGLSLLHGIYAVLNDRLAVGFASVLGALAISTALAAGVTLGEWGSWRVRKRRLRAPRKRL